MEPNVKPRMVRLETGTPKQIGDLIAETGAMYLITHWHFWSAGDEARVTCVMIHESIVRQMQIAQGAPPRGFRQ
jgi:hypothetical protein